MALAGCGGSDEASTANAGGNRTSRAGDTLQADGSASRGAQYRWTLTRKPLTSSAELDCASTPVATLTADAPGRYELELEVDGQRDVAVVQVLPTYTLTAVDTRVVSGDGTVASDYAMLIGTQSIAAPALPDGTANGIHVVAIDRLTQEVVANRSYPIATAADLQALINDMNNSWAMNADNLLLFSAMDLAQAPSADFSQIVTSIGAGPDVQLTTDFSIAGVRGLLAFQGFESVRGEQPLQGYLTLDTTGHYAFVQGDYLDFDTRAASSVTGNTISIGTTSFSATLPSGAAGGFQVVIVPRDGPAASVAPSPCASGAICPQNLFFATNDASTAESQQAMADMAAALFEVVTDETLLAFVASIGDPLAESAAGTSALTSLRLALTELGANPFVIDRMVSHHIPGTQNYSLVGAASPPAITGLPPVLATEASFTTVKCGPSQANCAQLQAARLRGEIGKGRRNLFEPRGATPIGVAELDLYQIAYQTPEPWPFTGSSPKPGACETTPKLSPQAAAFVYLSQLLLDSTSADADIRSQYTNGEFGTLYAGCLSLGSNPSSCAGPRAHIASGGPRFPGERVFERRFGVRVNESEFHSVVEQLNREFSDVVLVLGRFGLLASLIDQANEAATDVIGSIAGATFEKPPPPPTPPHVGISWARAIADGFALAGSFFSLIEVPGASGICGMIHAGIDLGCDLTRTSSGGPSQYSSRSVQVLADQQAWREEATTNFDEMQSGLQALAGVILSDWGKLRAIGDRIAEPEQYPGWVWSEGADGTTAMAIQAYTAGMAREYYGQGLAACTAIRDPGVGAVYVPSDSGGIDSDSALVMYGTYPDCTIFALPDSMETLQVLEPAQSCLSYPCPLGIATVDLFYRLHHQQTGPSCGSGLMVECSVCCGSASCNSGNHPDFPC